MLERLVVARRAVVDDVQVVTRSWRGHQVVHEVRGEGPETVVLIHGLLLPAIVNAQLADALVAAGYRVVQPELLGHGRSDAPEDPAWYRMDVAAEQVLDLLDDLGVDRAVVGGMSLGANVALAMAATSPERLAGMLCEMPVLERGTVGVMAALAPLYVAFRFASTPIGALFARIRALPRTGLPLVDAVLGCAGLPRSMAAVLHGYATGPVGPPRHVREAMTTPALVVGHGRDVIHPLDDAEKLVRELPGARFVRARHALELRTAPARLCAEVVAFVEEVLPRPRTVAA